MADVNGGVTSGVVDSFGSAQYGYAENGGEASGVVGQPLSSQWSIDILGGRIMDPDRFMFIPVGGS
jgi:hypothetical protein